MQPSPSRVVLLAGDGVSTRIVWNALLARFGDVPVIIEDRVPRSQLLARRAKKLGKVTVLGQLGFVAVIAPALGRLATRRVAQIKQEYGLDDSDISGAVTRVASANSSEAQALLRAMAPTVVVVNGTRILSAETLRCISARFINMHAGITPSYRGVHGGYWALSDGRPDMVGTTVHLVDEGIDIGQVIAQEHFSPTSADSFATYPYLHTAAGLPSLLKAVDDVLSDRLDLKQAPPSPSKLRTHPTLWGYLWRRATADVR